MALLIAAWIGDASSLTALSTGLPTVYVHAHYSREHEQEADTFALEYMRAHGVDTQHFADVMRRIVATHGGAADEHSYLSSHPPPKSASAGSRPDEILPDERKRPGPVAWPPAGGS